MVFVYSNCLGTFVFDKDGSLKEKIMFSADQTLGNAELLKDGDMLVSEKDALSRYKGAELAGFGKERTGNIPDHALAHFQSKKHLDALRKANFMITKKQIALSVAVDTLLIQATGSSEELDKITNGMAKRLRDWYELYNPEFSRSVHDHEKFVELILSKDKNDLLKECGVSAKAAMGADLADEDIVPMMDLAKEIQLVFTLREKQAKYIETKINEQYPNLSAVAGAMIGAKLISLAGGIQQLAKLPASTVQLLGAEKALFRHIRTGARPPKYGVIINHPIVVNVRKEDKGKASRALADKISIAVKVDYFKGEFVGDELRKGLEKRFNKK